MSNDNYLDTWKILTSNNGNGSNIVPSNLWVEVESTYDALSQVCALLLEMESIATNVALNNEEKAFRLSEIQMQLLLEVQQPKTLKKLRAIRTIA